MKNLDKYLSLLDGEVNGLLLTRLDLPHPFVSTMGMKNVLWGLGLLVTANQMVNNFPKSVQWLGNSTIGKWGGGFPVGGRSRLCRKCAAQVRRHDRHARHPRSEKLRAG